MKLLTIPQAAERFGLNQSNIHRALDRGTLKRRTLRVEVAAVADSDMRAYLARTGGKRGRPKATQ